MKVIKINKPKILSYSIYSEYNGTLIPFYTNKHFPKYFKLKRFFLLYGKSKFFRADHAHKKCSQIIIPLRGKIFVSIKSRKYLERFILEVSKKKCLMVPPYNWIKINFQNNQDSLLTLCDFKYDKREYISNYKNFLKIIKE
ncbi:MAG: hypothetical protein CBD95_006110 [Flavobacteriales bacterium TMED235]|nr:MAG: hypothetical protein CBD95_006110 [Flavobacteriales bacterium TMED235]